MKLNKIHISAFGGLKDFDLDFTDGLNLVYGENENGKTTITEFIKMMFYGSRGKTREEDIRGKYTPWDGSRMAGSIDFEHNGTPFRLERIFMSSNATDKINLINLNLGTTEVFTGKTSIGEKFFGMSLGAFEKSVFINNTLSSRAGEDADGEINSLLSNISETGDESVSFELIDKRISGAMNDLLTPTLRGGKIKKSEFELGELCEKRDNLESVYARRDALEAEIDGLTAKENELKAQKSKYFELLKTASENETREQLQKFITAAEKYNEAESKITLPDGTVASREFTDTARAYFSKVQSSAAELSAKNGELKRLEEDIFELEKQNSSPESSEKGFYTDKRRRAFSALSDTENSIFALKNSLAEIEGKISAVKPSPNIAVIVIGIALICIGLGTGFSVMPALFTFAAAGMIFVILGSFLKSKSNTAELENKADEIKSEIEKNEAQITDLRSELSAAEKALTDIEVGLKTGVSILTAKRQEYIEVGAEVTKKQSEFDTLRIKLFEYLSQICHVTDLSEVPVLISQTEQDIYTLNVLKSDADHALHGLNCKSLEEAKQKFELLKNKPEVGGTKAEYQAKMDDLSGELAEIKNRLTALKTEISAAFTGLVSLPEMERQISEKQNEISAMKAHYDALKTAREAMTAAYGELRQGFSGALNNRATQLFGEITGGKYESLNISKNFEISLQEKNSFGTHPALFLSRGAADQVYFALRLALSEQISTDAGSLPVIMDDIFSQYDDTRLAAAFKFLEDYARENQAILFTCHSSYKQNLRCTNIINL